MDIVEEYYGKLTFTFYALFMTLPGRNCRYRKIFVTFSVLVLSLSMIFQVLKFVTDGFGLKLIVELVPTILAILGSLLYILYLTFVNEVKFEKLLSAMQKDLKEARSAEETEIKKQFALNARVFTNIYTGILVTLLCLMALPAFFPYFLDLLMSANETRQAELLFNGEIFLDQHKYFYYIYFVEACTVAVVGVIVVTSENVAIIVGQHIAGMFAVLGYRLENLTEIKEEEMSKDMSYDDLVTRRLKKCIKSHQTSLEFSIRATEFYEIPVSLVLSVCFCTLVMSLVQVTDPQLVSVKMVVFTCGQFCELFIMSYMGQIVIDASLGVTQSAYYAKWDKMPGKVRKLLQMVILRSSKPCQVTARGIYVLSAENCMAVVHMITSFYMVIRQAD